MEILIKNKILGLILIGMAIIFLIAVVIFKIQIDNLTNS